MNTTLSQAIHALHQGNVIVYPTDTLYALGADIFNRTAVQKVYKLKKRPLSSPLPVAVSSLGQLKSIAYTTQRIEHVIHHFLPGPLAIILRKKSIVPDIVTNSSDKIAIRMPNNSMALHLLKTFGPLTATSANLHTQKTPYLIKDIAMQFNGEIAVYLDSNKLDGQPSTMVDLTTAQPTILRQGPISKQQIMEAIQHG